MDIAKTLRESCFCEGRGCELCRAADEIDRLRAELAECRAEIAQIKYGPQGRGGEMSDPINRPAHYTGEIECIDAMVAAFGIDAVKMYARIAAFKYQWRAGKKDALPQELGKAIWYLRFATGDDPREARAHKWAGIAKTIDADIAAYEQRLEGYRAQHGVRE